MKEEIQQFDARKITKDIRASVEELLEKSGGSFDPEKVSKINHFHSRDLKPQTLCQQQWSR